MDQLNYYFDKEIVTQFWFLQNQLHKSKCLTLGPIYPNKQNVFDCNFHVIFEELS